MTVFIKHAKNEHDRSAYVRTGSPVACAAVVLNAFYEHCQDEQTCPNQGIVAIKYDYLKLI